MRNNKEAAVKNGTGKAHGAGKFKRILYTALTAAVFILSMSISVFAEEENPLTILSNLEEFIFGIIRGIGIIMCGYGGLQIGTSFPTHDPSQRTMGIMTFAGGIIAAFSRQILTLIGVG